MATRYQLNIRLDEARREGYAEAAAECGLTLSQWARDALDAELSLVRAAAAATDARRIADRAKARGRRGK